MSTKSPVTQSRTTRRKQSPIVRPKTRRTVSKLAISDGTVFVQLGFRKTETENLLIRSHLMIALAELVAERTQVEAAAMLGVSQPRVSDLVRGKIGMFTIDALVNMLSCRCSGPTIDGADRFAPQQQVKSDAAG